MLKRVLEAMLYDPNSKLQGFRVAAIPGGLPPGWHHIAGYHHTTAKGRDFHFAASTLRAAPLTGSRFTEKPGYKGVVREGNDKYGFLNFTVPIGDYYINTPARIW